jgi:hypothetical protein
MPCGNIKMVYKSNKHLFLFGNPKIKNFNSVHKEYKKPIHLKNKIICKLSRNGDLITQIVCYL